MPEPVYVLAEDDRGGLLMVMRSGMKRLVDETLETYPLRDVPVPLEPGPLFRDRDGGLWIGNVRQGPSCMCTRVGRMCSHSLTVSQGMPF